MRWIAKRIGHRSSSHTLYLALYDLGGIAEISSGGSQTNAAANKFHWALIVCPTTLNDSSPGVKYHAVTEDHRTFRFDKVSTLDPTLDSHLAVRFALAEVINPRKLARYLERVPIRLEEPGWSSHSWVCEALHFVNDRKHRRLSCLRQKVLPWYKIKQEAICKAEPLMRSNTVFNHIQYSKRGRRYREKRLMGTPAVKGGLV